ncbi:hypothetical protein LQK80_00440 [Bacillus thuringiensis]|nr:hypothetical protein [Bacillus thuringiensis]
MGSETINPYAEMAGERNRVKWVLKIYKDGSEIDTKEGYIRSNPKKDSEKPEEGDAGYFGGKDQVALYDGSQRLVGSLKRNYKSMTLYKDQQRKRKLPLLFREMVVTKRNHQLQVVKVMKIHLSTKWIFQ